jgi:hypothetical protein
MKNIHILPTDKPSRLYYWEDKLVLGNLATTPMNRSIYITNDEEIKVGDWFYNSFLNEILKMDVLDYSNFRKKIILTTDQDLITDGIQSIPNEFLEWFVRNPNCDNVQVYDEHEGSTALVFSDYVLYIPKKNKIMKQTAVEWLIEEINQQQKRYIDLAKKDKSLKKGVDAILTATTILKIKCEQAKEMEKQQIIDARVKIILDSNYVEAEQYYNETFNK